MQERRILEQSVEKKRKKKQCHIIMQDRADGAWQAD